MSNTPNQNGSFRYRCKLNDPYAVDPKQGWSCQMALGTEMPSQCSSFRVARVAICRNFNYQAARGELHYLKNHRHLFLIMARVRRQFSQPKTAPATGKKFRLTYSFSVRLFVWDAGTVTRFWGGVSGMGSIIHFQPVWPVFMSMVKAPPPRL